MKGENNILKTALLVAIVAVIALVLVANTYAKYTTTVAGTDTAIVAKWEVGATLGGTSFASVAATVNIFNESAVYDTDGAASTVDTDVRNAAENAAAIIAPGTYGTFTYTLSNNSDVNATYSVVYSANEAGVPLQWSLDGTDWVDSITALNVSNVAINMPATRGTAVTTPITVYWKWAFEDDEIVTQTDVDDTILGEAGAAEPTATVTVTFNQVD